MKKSFIYSLKIWLTAAFVAPLFLLLFKMNPLGFIYFGLMFSVPSWVLLMLGTQFFLQKKLTMMQFKIRLSVLGVILTFLPFWLLFPPKDIFSEEGMVFSMALPALYAAVIVAGIFIYKIQLNTPAEAKEKEV
jgi:hypothetical protein